MGFNAKVRCVSVGVSFGEEFKEGGVYQFVNGRLHGDGFVSKGEFTSLEQWNQSHIYTRFELVEEKQFTKADLKTGMRVETVNGVKWIVFNELETSTGNKELVFINKNSTIIYGKYYDEELKRTDAKSHPDDYDISKVFNIKQFYKVLDLNYEGELLWQRPEPRQITKSEAEKLLSEQLEEQVKIID